MTSPRIYSYRIYSYSLPVLKDRRKTWTCPGLTSPLVLTGGKAVNATLTFAPTVTGFVAGSISIASNATNKTLTVTMSGAGVADTRTIAATPTSLSFGNENLGRSNTLPVTLKNTGNSGVTLSGVTISGTGIATSAVTGTTIAAGQTTTLCNVCTKDRGNC
jgi:hypothetical protein